MSKNITDNADTLYSQALTTSHEFMTEGRRYIDSTFGEGFAAKNPALVAEFMRSAAYDFRTVLHARCLEDIGSAIEQIALTYLEEKGE